MKEFKCPRCEKEYDSYDSLRRHNSRTHQITSENFFIEFNLGGIRPTCKCGCGENVSFRSSIFQEYIRGHHARVANNYHKDPSSLKRAHETRRQRIARGEIVNWCKGLTKETSEGLRKLSITMRKENSPERARRISKALTGKSKSKESTAKRIIALKKYWTPERRAIQREKRIWWLENKQKKRNTKLEIRTKQLFDSYDIAYIFQFRLSGFLYDFRIDGTNILVEIDGNFHHCHPEKWSEPKYPIQIATVKNDKKKNQVAESNGYKLIRIWESEINEDPEGSIKRVTDAILEVNLKNSKSKF